MATPVGLTLACGDYDRTHALHTGEVVPAGIDLRCVSPPASQIFTSMTGDDAFDIAEMSLSMYLIGLSHGDDRFVALPIFPLRALRHRDIYVAADHGVRRPQDLIGRRVALRHFHMTSAVWQRGILADDFGVATEQIRWVRAEIGSPGPVTPRIRLRLPDSIELITVTDRSLPQLIQAGDVAAGFLATAPPDGGYRLRRMFDDPRAVESDYHRRTGIYPIMHTVVVRRRLLRRHPWIAAAVRTAFEDAKATAYARALSASSPCMSPFHALDLERDRAEFGADLYPYGLPANRIALETFKRYVETQELASEPPPVTEWFDAEIDATSEASGSGYRIVED